MTRNQCNGLNREDGSFFRGTGSPLCEPRHVFALVLEWPKKEVVISFASIVATVIWNILLGCTLSIAFWPLRKDLGTLLISLGLALWGPTLPNYMRSILKSCSCLFSTVRCLWLLLSKMFVGKTRNKEFSNLFTARVREEDRAEIKHASYQLWNDVVLSVIEGSVTHFQSTNGAIVKAPENQNAFDDGTYIAKPDPLERYGVPNIIHAASPDFQAATERDWDNITEVLHIVYFDVLSKADESGFNQIAFQLLSTGPVWGNLSSKEATVHAVKVFKHWSETRHIYKRHPKKFDIVVCARSSKEANIILTVCNKLLSGFTKVTRT